MQSLSSSVLLNIWEQGQTQSPEERALCLLAAANPETSVETLAQLNLGRRDARLLMLREQTFGARLTGVTACPACNERLDLAFDVADILLDAAGIWPADSEALSLDVDGYTVHFRVLNSLDMVAVAACESAVESRRLLQARCILEAQPLGKGHAVAKLPHTVIDAVIARMAEVDPQANVDLDLTCPVCGHSWLAAFDIASFFWAEIESWAIRLLSDVHRLASAYGWCETDILAMTPWRRRCYLEMIGYG